MLSDEERAAVERLRPVRAGGTVGESYGSLGIGNIVDAIRNYQRDCYAVIDLALRDHPADEGEGVTLDWLESVANLVSDDAEMECCRVYANHYVDIRTDNGSVEKVYVVVKADVYALMRALKIEVKL